MKITLLSLFSMFSILLGENQKWIELPLYSVRGHLFNTSSELQKPADMMEIGRYDFSNVFDGNPATCWAEGAAGSGIGEKIFFVIPENLQALKITNGLAKNKVVFHKNNRVKKIKVLVYGGVTTDEDAGQFADLYRCLPFDKEFTIELKDTPAVQEIKFPFDWDLLKPYKTYILKKFEQLDYAKKNKSQRYFKYILSFEIVDVYTGSKWDDTCISDIAFITQVNNSASIEKIYTNDDENAVLFDTSQKTKNILIEDNSSVFQIVENSKDKNWLILIRMASDTGDSRAETEYRLYYLPQKKRIDLKKLGYNIGDMYDFTQEKGHIYLNCADKSTMDDLKIDLTNLVGELNR